MIAALTAQNTRAVSGVHTPPVDFLKRQIDTLFEDVRIDSVKLGMLGTADIVRTVADRLAHFKPAHVVLDPVMVAKSGDHLLAKSAVAMLKEALMPQANMITPNLPEGRFCSSSGPPVDQEMFRAAERLREMLPTRASAGCC